MFNSKKSEQRWFTESSNDKKRIIVLEGDNVEFGGEGLWINERETIQASNEPSPSMVIKTFSVLKAWERGLSLKERKIKKNS